MTASYHHAVLQVVVPNETVGLMRHLLLSAILALLLVACAPRPPERSFAATPQTLPLYPAFADVDPHDGVGRIPSRYPVHGVDLSRWQGDVNWRQAQAAGISFAYIKATEGADLLDPMFQTYRLGARAVGLRYGAYHYYYFCRSAAEQAQWFIAHVPNDPGALPPVLDMEWNHRSPTCRRQPDGATVRAEAATFLDLLERHYGRRPVIYTTVDFYRDTGIGQLPRTDFWLRSVAGHPAQVYPGANWTFWQYTGTGVVPGFSRPVDINAFAGSPDQWRLWAQ